MKQKTKDFFIKIFGNRPLMSLMVIMLNVVLLACAIGIYSYSFFDYRTKLTDENLKNVANINNSAANAAEQLIDGWTTKLNDITLYLNNNDLTATQALDYIAQSNSSSKRCFQLIGSDYCGYSSQKQNGNYIAVDYSLYWNLRAAFDDVSDSLDSVRLLPEFNDSVTGIKFVGLYKHVSLQNELGEDEMYTIILASKRQSVNDFINQQLVFEGQSSVIIAPNGDYVVKDVNFTSTNFFKYIEITNDLSLDERNEIAQEVASKEKGGIYYKNTLGTDCYFCYERMPDQNWYAVTCVPISSFLYQSNINFALFASLLLVVVLVMDIVWLIVINKRIRSLAEREKAANAAKTDFLSRMSHDIRTPLNGIIGLTDLAMDESNPPVTQEYLSNIKVSGQFLTALINDILDLSRVENGKVQLHLEPCTNEDFMHYVDAVIAPLCTSRDIKLVFPPAVKSQPIMLDRLRFNQILFNLLSNAAKYTPPGGTVTFGWTRTDLPNNRVAVDFSVSDTGIGMSKEFQQHMFEPFTQENAPDTSVTGAGLGLAIVKSLLNLMNGTIEVHSVVGEGSTFTVHLETDAASGEKIVEDLSENVALNGKHILVCEDNKINVLVVRRLLEKWGVIVEVYDNGEKGVKAFCDSEVGYYDAVLMDMMMPVMDGLAATKQIRSKDRADARTLPIIAMTANAYDTDVRNCLEAGMNAHISKPIDVTEFKKLLSRVVEDKSNSK